MNLFVKPKHPAAMECVIAALLFAGLFLGGWRYLAVHTDGPVQDFNNTTGDDFLCALSWASGHGMGTPSFDVETVPGLRDFLERRAPSWDAAALPEDFTVMPPDGKFQVDRYYLLWAVAVTWRLFGVSWASLNILCALAYALSGMLCYGIFRLGMNRPLSVLGTLLYATAPIMLYYLPSMRDFFRAPPILATILVCGWLVTGTPRRTVFLALAAATGLVIGFGFGFRQDAIICLPPALAAFAAGARNWPPTGLFPRLAAVLLVLAGFYLPARPMLTMTQDSGGNNAFYLLQGFGCNTIARLGMVPASYETIGSNGDYTVHAALCAFDRNDGLKRTEARNRAMVPGRLSTALCGIARMPMDPAGGLLLWKAGTSKMFLEPVQEIWSKPSEEAGRRMLLKLAETFPADILSKWLGASVRALRGMQGADYQPDDKSRANAVIEQMTAAHKPLSEHLKTWGVLYGFAALLLISAHSVRLALGALALLLYFAGYTSISFDLRHAFHMQFIAAWAPLFLLGCLWKGAAGLLTRGGRIRIGRFTASPRGFTAPLGRAALFAVLCGALIGAPLCAARTAQHRTVARLAEAHQRAELEPLSWTESKEPFLDDISNYTLCSPDTIPGLRCPLEDSAAAEWLGVTPALCNGVRVQYLAAELEVNVDQTNIVLQYGPEAPHLLVFQFYRFPGRPRGERYTFFFPVYEFTKEFKERHHPNVFSEFGGLRLLPGVKLLSLNRVRNREDFPFLTHLWLPENMDHFKWCQKIPLLGGV